MGYTLNFFGKQHMENPKSNSFSNLITDLNNERELVDEFYKTYSNIDSKVVNPDFLEAVAIALQMSIYVADIRELMILIHSDSPDKFSMRCASRLAVLRIVERSNSFGPTYARLRETAKKIKVENGDDEYKKVTKELKSERLAIQGLASVRHTAGHYFVDAINFIKEIESVNVKEVKQHMAEICQIASSLIQFAVHIFKSWPNNKLTAVS